VVATALASACAAAKPSPPTGAPLPATADKFAPPAPESSTGTAVHGSGSAARGAALLEKALRGMGGAAAVDRVASLQLTGEFADPAPGQESRARMVESIFFPDRYRLDLTVGTVTLSTILNRTGAFLETPQGSWRLPEGEQRELEKSVMRNPLALLKTRRDPTFDALGAAAGEVAVRQAEQLVILSGGDATTLWLEPDTGRITEMDYTIPGGGKQKAPRRRVVRFSDFRATGSLVYPFIAETADDDQPSSTVRLDSVVVDALMNAGAFEAPAAAVAPAPAAPQNP
jgi:hypothetical protein